MVRIWTKEELGKLQDEMEKWQQEHRLPTAREILAAAIEKERSKLKSDE